MPKRRRARLPLMLRLRNVLLLATLGFVGALIALYLFGRSGVHETTPAAPQDPVVTQEGVAQSGGQFDYTQYEADRPLFRVQGDRYTMDRNSVANLEEVEITVFRPGGDYQATSETAVYRQDQGSAQLDSNVELTGPDGLKVFTEQLLVAPQGRRVVSPKPVAIEFGTTLEGSAQRLQVEVPTELYLLHGRVSIRTRADVPGPPTELKANRAFLEGGQRLLRAEGKVSLTQGQDQLFCRRLSTYLAEGTNRPEFVRAKWSVRGQIQVRRSATVDSEGEREGAAEGAPETIPMQYFAENAVVLFNAAGTAVRKVELEGSANRTAMMYSTDPVSGNLRRITANYMVGDFQEEGLTEAQIFGQVRIAEIEGSDFNGEALREARSERALGRFRDDGVLHEVTLIGNVRYRDEEVRLTARRGEMELDTGAGLFLGGPAPSGSDGPARLVSDQGEMTAPRIRYNRTNDVVRANGGVRTSFQPGTGPDGVDPLPSALLGDGEGPVWVESQDALWTRSTNTSTFRGAVRAWRDRNLLLAEELRAVPAEERLIASGGVKTVWFPERGEGTAPPPTAGQPGSGPARPRGRQPAAPGTEPLEVTAENLDYLGKLGQARFTEAVRIVDGPRRMECDEAEVELTDEGDLSSLLCAGNALLDDRSQGKVVTGERSVYNPSMGTVEVRGNPVILKDKDGTQLEGRRVIYDLNAGTARFLSAPPAVAETGDP